jgi:methionyl-tRNA formyltransferase
MRVGFAGTPEFAARALAALHEGGYTIPLVLTQPDRPSGRGMVPSASPVKRYAQVHGLPLAQPPGLRNVDVQAQLRDVDVAVLVVAAYGLILPQAVLDWPRHGCLNIHASLLPRWRGAAPIQRAILAGDEVSGVTIMQMEEGLDTGPMLHRLTLDIRGKNAGQVTDELANLGAQALLDWIGNPTPPEPQPIAGASYAKKVDKAEARIDWSKPAAEIELQVRAFAPSPGAWFEAGGERIKLLEANAIELIGAAGKVLDDHLTIGTGSGSIRPVKVQRAGRAPMNPENLLRGFPIAKGTKLS